MITEEVTIDGYTQSGASPNTLAVGNDADIMSPMPDRATQPARLKDGYYQHTRQPLPNLLLVTAMLVFIETVLTPGSGLPVGFMFTAGLVVLATFIAVRYRLRLVTGLAAYWINLRSSQGGYSALRPGGSDFRR
jgi:hypothetical protein